MKSVNLPGVPGADDSRQSVRKDLFFRWFPRPLALALWVCQSEACRRRALRIAAKQGFASLPEEVRSDRAPDAPACAYPIHMRHAWYGLPRNLE
jgi:hypothetical protein